MNTTTYTIAKPGATSLKDMELLTFGLNRYLTVQMTDGHAAVFVGTVLHYEGPLPAGISERSPEFYTWAIETATAGEASMEQILDNEQTAQVSKNVRGFRMDGSPDQSAQEQAKVYRMLDALRPEQFRSYGAFRKFWLGQLAWERTVLQAAA